MLSRPRIFSPKPPITCITFGTCFQGPVCRGCSF